MENAPGLSHVIQRGGMIGAKIYSFFLIFNTIFLLLVLEFHIIQPSHFHFPVFLGPLPTLVTSLKEEGEIKQKTRTSLICVAYILTRAWLNFQWPAL